MRTTVLTIPQMNPRLIVHFLDYREPAVVPCGPQWHHSTHQTWAAASDLKSPFSQSRVSCPPPVLPRTQTSPILKGLALGQQPQDSSLAQALWSSLLVITTGGLVPPAQLNCCWVPGSLSVVVTLFSLHFAGFFHCDF